MTESMAKVRPAGHVPAEEGHVAVEVNVDGNITSKRERVETTVAVAVPAVAEPPTLLLSVIDAEAEAGLAITVTPAATIAAERARRTTLLVERRRPGSTEIPYVVSDWCVGSVLTIQSAALRESG